MHVYRIYDWIHKQKLKYVLKNVLLIGKHDQKLRIPDVTGSLACYI